MTTTLPVHDGPRGGSRVVGGRYRLLAPLGEGGMGRVWRAQRTDTGVEVAVKILRPELCAHPESQARFEREARAAARLSHPGCVAVHDFGRDGEGMYLVMELVRGRLLSERLAAGKLPAAEAARIADGVLAALAHAHALGVVHRDLKPANVMLARGPDGDEVVKLLDFGVARVLVAEPDGVARHRTAAGVVMGTPQYLSPEQALGEPGDARSDVYAVGVLLYEMLTGVQPFAAATHREVLSAHIARTPPPPSRAGTAAEGAPAPFDAALVPFDGVVMRALAKAAGERYATAGDLRVAVTQACLAAGLELPVTEKGGAPLTAELPVPGEGPMGTRKLGEPATRPGPLAWWRARSLRERGIAAAVALALAAGGVSLVLARGDRPRGLGAEPTAEPEQIARVRAHLARGDLDAARAAAEDLAVQHPDDPRAFLWLGHALFASRDKRRGLAAYREVVRLERGAVDAELVANLRATFADRAVGEEAFDLAERIGPPALAAVQDLARDTREARQRARAQRAVGAIVDDIAADILAATRWEER